MKAGKGFRRGGAALAAVMLAACGSDGDSEQTGSLTLLLTDAPVHDVAEIWVQFDGVTLRREGGPPIEIHYEEPKRFDLLQLTPDDAAVLLDTEPLPAGNYTQLALHVSAQHDGIYDSVVVENGGGEVEIFVPSGAQTGLKMINGFTITADQETRFMIDWDARMGLTNPPGLSGYILRPTVRIIDMTEYGTLRGSVSVAHLLHESCTNDLNLDTGNAVYIYEAFDVTQEAAGDIGGDGNEPVATANVALDGLGSFRYETILSPGEYVAAFTCQAGDDHPEEADDLDFIGAVVFEIATGATVEVDFD